MILFFAKGRADSDAFIRYCYSHYRDIIGGNGGELPKEINIVRGQNKKPRCREPGIYFSLSHSRGVTMLGISHSEIGVDIEKKRPIDYEKFKFIDARNPEEFFERWTERESYLKFTGEGLSALKCEIPEDAHFEHFPVFGDYHACVCAEEQSIIAYEIDIKAVE